MIECDGHDIAAIVAACEAAKAVKGRPSVIVAQTVKGKGVSFMENTHLVARGPGLRGPGRAGARRALRPEAAHHRRAMAQRDAFGEALVDLGARNERVVA